MKRHLHHILLVDDNDDDNFFHQRAIRKTGFDGDISVCRDGSEAIELLRQIEEAGRAAAPDTPELIFLDINMPRLNGWEFIDAYATLDDDIHKAMIIMMLSTSPHPTDKEKAEASPFVEEFINKPLTKEEMQRIAVAYFDVPTGG